MTITKILATSDTHFQFDSSKWPSCDVFIHAGDLMMSGKEKESIRRIVTGKQIGRAHV